MNRDLLDLVLVRYLLVSTVVPMSPDERMFGRRTGGGGGRAAPPVTVTIHPDAVYYRICPDPSHGLCLAPSAQRPHPAAQSRRT